MSIYRAEGYVEYMEENCPDINILDQRWTPNDPASALAEMDDALVAYDKIDAVYSVGEMIGQGAFTAIEAAGLEDEIIVTSVDPSPSGIEMLKKGQFDAMVVQDSTGLGRWGIRLAINILEGRAKELVHQYWTPIYLVTKDNVNEFNFEGISVPPAGWVLP